MPGYCDYWGKAQPAPGCDIKWHPVAYHGLDVAAVGEALLNSRPQLLAALARISGLPEGLARSWLLFGLAIHDVGKFACCFQAKVKERFRHSARWGTAKPLGADPGHGRTGLALWEGGCDIDGLGARDFTRFFGSDWDVHCGFNHWMAAPKEPGCSIERGVA